jgi:hypothetical protein
MNALAKHRAGWLIALAASCAFVPWGEASVSGETLLTVEQEVCLHAIARNQPWTWSEMNSEQANVLGERAASYFQHYQEYHLPQGINVDIVWRDRNRSAPIQYKGVGDGAIWTGHYLAMLVFKFAATGDRETREAILDVLDTIDMLANVSGRTGYIARYAGTGEDPAFVNQYRVAATGKRRPRRDGRRLVYEGAPPYEDYLWLGNSSRDSYDGIRFGLSIAWQLSGDDEVRARAESIIALIVDRLVHDEWWIRDGRGGVTRPTSWWKLAWMRTALTVCPGRVPRIDRAYDWQYRRAMMRKPAVRSATRNKYYPNNLRFLRMYHLAAFETDPRKAKEYKALLTRSFYEGAAGHLNGHFAALYMAGTNDPQDQLARATLQGTLLDFPPPPKWARAVDLRDAPSIERTHWTGAAEYALLPRERVPRDFIWQRSPCTLHGGTDEPLEYPGLDFLLPYWIGRAVGAVPPPTAAP